MTAVRNWFWGTATTKSGGSWDDIEMTSWPAMSSDSMALFKIWKGWADVFLACLLRWFWPVFHWLAHMFFYVCLRLTSFFWGMCFFLGWICFRLMDRYWHYPVSTIGLWWCSDGKKTLGMIIGKINENHLGCCRIGVDSPSARCAENLGTSFFMVPRVLCKS